MTANKWISQWFYPDDDEYPPYKFRYEISQISSDNRTGESNCNIQVVCTGTTIEHASGGLDVATEFEVFANETSIKKSKQIIQGSYVDITPGSLVSVCSYTDNFAHDQNGILTIKIKAKVYLGEAGDDTEAMPFRQWSQTVNNVERSFNLKVPEEINYGEDVELTIESDKEDAIYEVRVVSSRGTVKQFGSMGSSKKIIGRLPDGTGDDRYSFMSEHPNSRTMPITFEAMARVDGKIVDSVRVQSLAVVPDSMKPTFQISSLVPKNKDGIATVDDQGNRLYILGGSAVQVVTANEAASPNATISSWVVTIGNVMYEINGSHLDFISSILKSPGETIVSIYCVDSRGMVSETNNNTINVRQYSAPTISLSVSRCDSDGVSTMSGIFFKAEVDCTCYSINTGIADRPLYTLRYRKHGSSTWNSYILDTHSHTIRYVTTPISADPDDVYDVQFTVEDDIGEIRSAATTVSSAKSIMHFGLDGKSLGLGCEAPKNTEYASQGLLDIGYRARFLGGIKPTAIEASGTEETQQTDITDLSGSKWHFAMNYVPSSTMLIDFPSIEKLGTFYITYKGMQYSSNDVCSSWWVNVYGNNIDINFMITNTGTELDNNLVNINAVKYNTESVNVDVYGATDTVTVNFSEGIYFIFPSSGIPLVPSDEAKDWIINSCLLVESKCNLNEYIIPGLYSFDDTMIPSEHIKNFPSGDISAFYLEVKPFTVLEDFGSIMGPTYLEQRIVTPSGDYYIRVGNRIDPYDTRLNWSRWYKNGVHEIYNDSTGTEIVSSGRRHDYYSEYEIWYKDSSQSGLTGYIKISDPNGKTFHATSIYHSSSTMYINSSDIVCTSGTNSIKVQNPCNKTITTSVTSNTTTQHLRIIKVVGRPKILI